MSFLRGKRRVKFNVEMTVLSLMDVPLLNAVIFAKVRLMECGSFEGFTWHCPVQAYRVDFMQRHPLGAVNINGGSRSDSIFANDLNTEQLEKLQKTEQQQNSNPQPFKFQCRIPFDERTGELEECQCKLSIRREDKTGRSPQKLSFVVLNLSEYAASGTAGITQSYLLDGYSDEQRQDNSRVQVHIKMQHQAQDPLFKVPMASLNSSVDESQLNPVDRKAPSVSLPSQASVTASSSTNTGSIEENISIQTQQVHRPVSAANIPTANTIINSTAERSSWHLGFGSYNAMIANNQQPSTSSSANTIPGNPQNIRKHGSRRRSEERLIIPNNSSSAASRRVQDSRRDAEDVIEEVLAETSELLRASSSSGSSESSADEEFGRVMDEGAVKKVKRSKPRGLTLYISNDRNTAVLGQAGCSPDPNQMAAAAAAASETEKLDQTATVVGNSKSVGGVEERRIIDEIVNDAAAASASGNATLIGNSVVGGAIKKRAGPGGFQRVSWPDP